MRTVPRRARTPRKDSRKVKKANWPVDLFWKFERICGTREIRERAKLDFWTSSHYSLVTYWLPENRTKE